VLVCGGPLTQTAANITTIASGHALDAMCFLLGEFSNLSARASCAFPIITTPHHSKPVHRDAFDSLSVQGVLESGTSVNFHMYSTTAEAAASLTWTITGEKGSLRFDGTFVNLQMVPPTLSCQRGGGDKGVWEIAEVKEALASGLARGQVGELYYAFANGRR
jgi:predicted dehydrogenase